MTGYEQLAQIPLGDNILAQIAGVARDIEAAKADVAEAERVLKDKQATLRVLQENTLPDLMNEAGQTELTTTDGLVVTVKDYVRGNPSKEQEPAAVAWLRSVGQGGIVKSRLTADLGKLPEDKVAAAEEALRAQGIRDIARGETVHPQTLLAAVREMLEEGKDVPLGILGIQQMKKAEVKPAKKVRAKG